MNQNSTDSRQNEGRGNETEGSRLPDEYQTLAENYLRMLALEDNLESVYDVNLVTGQYDVCMKGQIYAGYIGEKLTESGSFFEDTEKNIDAVVWPEDREDLKKALRRENIFRVLADSSHFDYCCRLTVNEAPMWFRMRIVYKNEEKLHLIVGIFNAGEERNVQQLQQSLADIAAVNRRSNTLHNTHHAAMWSYDINAADEVISATYDNYADSGTVIRNTKAPMAWVNAIHADDRKRVLAQFMESIRDHSGKTPYDVTYRVKMPDGTYMWMKTSGRLCRHEDGSAELFGISMDITDRTEYIRE